MQRIYYILLAFLCLPSCYKKPSPPLEKTTLHLNITQDPLTLDPRKGSDFVSSSLQFLLYDGLTRMTPYSTVSLGIAEKIDVSDDMTKYTFYLKDTKWSNGESLTAFDFVQTWKDMLNPNFPCPNAHLLYPIKNAEKAKRGLVSERQIGLRALDHKTLEVYLEQPTPYFLELVSFCVFFPINQNLIVRNAKWSENSNDEWVGNGPYRLSKWKKGSEIILEKNPYYWNKDNVRLDAIHVSIVDNELTAFKMYEMDELDILGLPFTGIPSDSIPSLKDKGQIKTTSLPGSTMCCFNMSSFPLTNHNIRKAFAYAINRQEIVDNITQTGEELGIHLIPKIWRKHQPTPFFKDGDQEQARAFFVKGLKELGITKEELGPITLLHVATGIYPKIAQAIQNQWRTVLGVQVELTGYEYKIFLDKLIKRDYQIGQCIWIAQYNDPMNFFERFKNISNPKNYPGYDNPKFAELLDKSYFYPDPEARSKILQEAEEILTEDMPLTALYHWNTTYLQKPYVKDLQTNPIGGFFFEEISIDKKPS